MTLVTAVVWVGSLAQELPHAMGLAEKKRKRKRKERKEEGRKEGGREGGRERERKEGREGKEGKKKKKTRAISNILEEGSRVNSLGEDRFRFQCKLRKESLC